MLTTVRFKMASYLYSKPIYLFHFQAFSGQLQPEHKNSL